MDTHSPLLQLPLEIRIHIYSYLLPATISHPTKGAVWQRGNTAVLATNRQIYQETITLLYGNSTFSIDVEWDSITFKYQWILPSGLVPTRTMKFPDDFAVRNVSLMRRLKIRAHHVDSYTGMVKYNYGGYGLTDGLRGQVKDLCRVLEGAKELTRLEIELHDGNKDIRLGQTLLDPFSQLPNVRQVILTGRGAVSSGRTPEKNSVRHDQEKAVSLRQI